MVGPAQDALLLAVAGFALARGEGVVEIADGGRVVVGHLNQGEDVAVLVV